MIRLDAIDLVAARALLARAATENVPSPCVSVCCMDGLGRHCEGCLRSLDEIGRWSRSSDAEKKAIWAAIETRIAALRATATPATQASSGDPAP